MYATYQQLALKHATDCISETRIINM